MAGPGALLLLGGLLGCGLGGGGGEGGGTGTPPPPPGDLELEALLLREELQEPKCFSRGLHDLTCFWDSDAPPDPRQFTLRYRLEQDPWQPCPVSAAPARGSRSRFSCSFPAAAAVAFVPLELQVLPPPPGPPLLRRTLFIDQVVLLGPPQNVSAVPGGRGQLCVRWEPPPSPYLESSLVYELSLSTPGQPPRTVGVPAGRREQRVGSLRGSSSYSVRARTRPDGLSYGGFWSPWSPPGSASTPPDVDPVTLGMSCLLVLLLLGLLLLGLLGHRRALQEKLWPPVPGPEREFEGLFSSYGGNFQLWLCQGVGAPWAPPGPPPDAEELPSTVEEVGPPPGKGPPLSTTPPNVSPPPPPTAPPPPATPSPSSSFEYTLFDPSSALLCPPAPPKTPPGPPQPHGPYANLAPPKGAPLKWGSAEGGPLPGDGDPPALAPPYVLCS